MTQSNEDSSNLRSRRIKFWGIAIVVLMIGSMLPGVNLGGGGGGRGHGSSVVVGTLRDGTRVTADDVARARQLLESLEHVYVQVGQMPRPLLELCWGPEAVQKFQRNPEALFLLLHESRKGPGASPLTLGPINPEERSTRDTGVFNSGVVWLDQLHPLPTSPLGQAAVAARGGPMLVALRVLGPDRRSLVSFTDLSNADQHTYHQSLGDFLAIQSAASLAPASLKVSSPLVERLVAERMQTVSFRAAPIEASAQLADVPEPTTEQLAAHFAQFAGRAPGVATDDNPFGFGYRVPDRVKLEWVTIDRAAVRAVVEAEKTPYLWRVDTRKEFLRDPSQFASLAPTSRPAGEGATTAPAVAATQPTFEAIADEAIRQTIDRETEKRMGEVERRLRQALNDDFQSWTTARVGNATTAPTKAGVPIEASDYIDRVAKQVGEHYKLTLRVDRLTDALVDRDEIAARAPTFAAMRRLDGDARTELAAAGPAYAIRAATTRPAEDQATHGDAPPQLYQPSQTLSDLRGNSRAIFRVVAAEANHPATDLATVRDRAVADWRIAQAQAKALAWARTIADAIRAGGAPPSAALAWQPAKLGDMLEEAAIPLKLAPAAAQQFRTAANDVLLIGAPSEKPVGAVDVPLARRVFVVQREQIDATWTSAEQLDAWRDQGRAQLAALMTAPASTENPYGLASYALDTAFLDIAKIQDRNGWKPSQPDAH